MRTRTLPWLSSWSPSRPRPPLLGLLLQHLPFVLQAPAGIMASPPSPTAGTSLQHPSRGTLTPKGAGLGLSSCCFSQQRHDEIAVLVRTLRFGCSCVNSKPFAQEMKNVRPTSPRTLASLRYSFPSLEMGQKKESVSGTSLAVQWLRRHTSTAGDISSTPSPGKILHAARCSQKIKFFKKVSISEDARKGVQRKDAGGTWLQDRHPLDFTPFDHAVLA